jgi:hypothetical protein
MCSDDIDIGDNLAPANHAELAAPYYKPFVSEENYWIVQTSRNISRLLFF